MNCKTLVTRGTEKETLPLVSCNTSHSTSLKENAFSQTHSENVLIYSFTAAWLAQLGERRSVEREVTGSNPGRTNTQGL